MEEKINEALNKSCNNEADIKDIKDNSKWLWRTTLGGIVLMIISLIKEYIIK